MCKCLKISRSSVYYKPVDKASQKCRQIETENAVISEFKSSRNNYGIRKLRIVLQRKGYIISRKRIGRIMANYSFVSNYIIKQFKNHKTKPNEDKTSNIVGRKFNQRKHLEVIASNLTCLNLSGK